MTEAELALSKTTSHSEKRMKLAGIVAKERFPDRIDEIDEHLAIVTEVKSVTVYALLQQYGGIEELIDNGRQRARLLARIDLDNTNYALVTMSNSDLDRWFCKSKYVDMPISDQMDVIGTFLNPSIKSIEKLTLMSLPVDGESALQDLTNLIQALEEAEMAQMEPVEQPQEDDTQSQP